MTSFRALGRLFCAVAAGVFAASTSLAADDIDALLDRASQFESKKLSSLVKNLNPAAKWIDGEDKLWLREQREDGARFIVVDATTGEKSEAFDHERLASSLSAAGEKNVAADALPISDIVFDADTITIWTAKRTAYRCAVDVSACEAVPALDRGPGKRFSPDRRKVAFVRDHNLWVRGLTSGEETQLTTDGEKYFAYGRDNIFSSTFRILTRPMGGAPLSSVNWSPDSRYLAVMRADLRDAPMRSYVKEHLPKDENFTTVEIAPVVVAADEFDVRREISVIDTETGKIAKADISSDKLHDYAQQNFSGDVVWWSLDTGEFFFITAELGGQTYGLAAMDITSGAVRTVVEETLEPLFFPHPHDYRAANFHVTSDGKDAIFYSMRSGYGHFYLYDAQKTNSRKSVITKGRWTAFDFVHADEEERVLYFSAGGREKDANPYHSRLYRAPLDGGAIELLTLEDAAHEFPNLQDSDGRGLSYFSASGEYFIDKYSTIEEPTKLVLRKKGGSVVSEIVEADISALLEKGWRAPERFVVKADDARTSLYGAMFKPLNFDPSKSYAIVNNTYPGPQGQYAPVTFNTNFVANTTWNVHALAEMGIIVVALDGRGTAYRGLKFRNAFRRSKDALGAADHVAALTNLAKRRPYIDLNRVGLSGASFGGYGSLRAALLYPDFFKAVVSHVGPHEYLTSVLATNDVYRYFGVPGGVGDNHANASNADLAENLRAELMLVNGEIDENVPLRSAMVIIDALIKADKDFVSYIVPNAEHTLFLSNPYIMKRERKFFFEHLGGPQIR